MLVGVLSPHHSGNFTPNLSSSGLRVSRNSGEQKSWPAPWDFRPSIPYFHPLIVR